MVAPYSIIPSQTRLPRPPARLGRRRTRRKCAVVGGIQGIRRKARGIQGLLRKARGIQGIRRKAREIQGIRRKERGIQGTIRGIQRIPRKDSEDS